METHDIIRVKGDTLFVDLWYPSTLPVKKVSVGLVDVRAASPIIIEYDYDRDGYSIKQHKLLSEDKGYLEMSDDYFEVAFISTYLE